jgi:hypothetical protein
MHFEISDKHFILKLPARGFNFPGQRRLEKSNTPPKALELNQSKKYSLQESAHDEFKIQCKTTYATEHMKLSNVSISMNH